MSSKKLCGALALLLGVLSPRVCAGDRGRVHQDRDRSLVEQREAARRAADRVALGEPADVAMALADPSAWVRDAALAALVERCTGDALDRLEPLLRHDDPRVVGGLAEAMGLRERAGAREALEHVARTRPEEVALEAVWALEALAHPASAEALEAVLDRRREPRLRGDALIALARVAPMTAAARARDALGARDPVLRIAALRALSSVDPAAAVRGALAVVRGVDGDDPVEARVLFAAVRAIRGWAEGPWVEDRPDDDRALLREVLDLLISRLDRVAEGRPRAEVHATVVALARSGPPDADARAWRDWWAAARVGFVPPDAPVERPAHEGTTTRVRFHGVPVTSTRLVFVQDVSGGMRGPLDAHDPRSPSRLAFSLDELRRVLLEMPGEAWVDVAFFATEWQRAAGRLVPLGRARRPLIDVVARTGGEVPRGQGQARSNLHDTLAALLLDERIDTVYLLSEGGCTEGRFVDPDRVLRHLARLNVYAQVQVHCLQVTENRAGARFLAALAEAMGGTFHTLESLRNARR